VSLKVVSYLQACALSHRRSAAVPKCPSISAEMSTYAYRSRDYSAQCNYSSRWCLATHTIVVSMGICSFCKLFTTSANRKEQFCYLSIVHVSTMNGLYKPRTSRTGRWMNHAPDMLAAPALIYSTHRLLVVSIIVAHFNPCSLLDRYTALEV